MAAALLEHLIFLFLPILLTNSLAHGSSGTTSFADKIAINSTAFAYRVTHTGRRRLEIANVLFMQGQLSHLQDKYPRVTVNLYSASSHWAYARPINSPRLAGLNLPATHFRPNLHNMRVPVFSKLKMGLCMRYADWHAWFANNFANYIPLRMLWYESN